MNVNRAKDFVERVGWTFVQAFAAALLVLGFNDWKSSLAAAATAGAIAALKVIVAQNAGAHSDGAAIPGGVIQPQPKP